jgi:hypothetical protein
MKENRTQGIEFLTFLILHPSALILVSISSFQGRLRPLFLVLGPSYNGQLTKDN